MNRLNWIFSISSFSVLLVTIERFSFTTKVLLQPYAFLRLHEVIQMLVIILLTVIVPTLLLREITNNFQTIKSNKSFIMVLLFVVGVYFYATGNGLHEVSSFNFNHYCNQKHFTGNLCGGFFFNDYYTGNILYFIGAFLMTIPLLLLEKENPNKKFKKRDMPLLIINAILYAVALFAYAAFDVVVVGLLYTIITLIVVSGIFFTVRKEYFTFPITTYTFLTYLIGTVAAVVVRLGLHH
jgi:hypothetical protein